MMSKSLEIIPRLKKTKGENQSASTTETAFCKEEENLRCQRHYQDEERDEKTAGLKPLYHRPRGQLGVCVDIYSATPADPRSVGSHLFFLQSLLEQLYLQLRKRQLHDIKGHFLRHGHLEGVVIESIHPGVIILASFDELRCLDQLCKDFQDGSFEQTMNKLLQQSDLDTRKFGGLESIEFRTRIFDDEVEKCRRELINGIPSKTLSQLPCDVCILRVVKDHQLCISGRVVGLKEELRLLDQHLSEFILAYRQILSADVLTTKSLADFEKNVQKADQASCDDRRTRHAHFDRFLSLIQTTRDVLMRFEEDVCHPLSQIHSDCESANQRETKRRIRQTLSAAQAQLDKDFNISSLSHPSVRGKILAREEGLVMGLLSVAALAVESAESIDNDLDEYFSAPPLQKLFSL